MLSNMLECVGGGWGERVLGIHHNHRCPGRSALDAGAAESWAETNRVGFSAAAALTDKVTNHTNSCVRSYFPGKKTEVLMGL